MKNYQSKEFSSKKGKVTVFRGLCKGCGLCIEKCPVKAISYDERNLGVYATPSVSVDTEKCIYCGICETICPDCALRVEKEK